MRSRLWGIVLSLVCTAAPCGGASALDVTCIESSKYKYLYRIFGNDRKKFAEFLELDPNRLPNPEYCRAVLVSGTFDVPSAKGADKLLAAIGQNQGWLAAIHLASGGGNVATGYQTAFLTRAFWLKTSTVSLNGKNLVYSPDFFVAPLPTSGSRLVAEPSPDLGLEKGWQDYLAVQKTLPPIALSGGGCASACTMPHIAGVDRFGIVLVHRPRFMGKDSSGKKTFIDQNRSMSATNEALMRSEKMQVAFYNDMDPGTDFVRLFQATPPETLTPVEVSRSPRFVADYINAKCNTDAGQLQRLERQIGFTQNALSSRLYGLWIRAEHLSDAERKIREQRGQAEKCVAAAQEKERLAAFAKLCGRACDHQKIMTMIDGKLRDLQKVP
jgi:hypothetical protein